MPGQSHLIDSLKNLQEILITPSCFEAFGFDPDFGGLLVAKKIQCEMTEYHQIVISMSHANTRLIFPKREIKHPMDTVFNAPMTANARGEAVNVSGEAEQVIACMSRYLIANPPLGHHHANRLQAFPFFFCVSVA